jgi:acyl transferase domain-containing protein
VQYLLPLSARNQQALRGIASAYVDLLAQTEHQRQFKLAEIVRTASVHRSHIYIEWPLSQNREPT